MEQEKIKLFGNRDFSGNFDMSLSFVRQNYGIILRGICIVIPLILMTVFLTPTVSDLLTPQVNTYDDLMGFYSGLFSFNYIIISFLTMISSLLINTYVIVYMALYAKSVDGVVKSSEAWSKVLDVILPLMIASIIFSILLAIGFMLCLVPGIVLLVYYGLFIYVYVNEDRSMINSFHRSFELVTNNWWVTFGYGLVFCLLILIARFLFIIPSYLPALGVSFEISFFTSDIYMYMASLINNMGNFLLYPLLSIAMGVMYYSHRNKLEGIDMVSEIDNIGNNTDNQPTQY